MQCVSIEPAPQRVSPGGKRIRSVVEGNREHANAPGNRRKSIVEECHVHGLQVTYQARRWRAARDSQNEKAVAFAAASRRAYWFPGCTALTFRWLHRPPITSDHAGDQLGCRSVRNHNEDSLVAFPDVHVHVGGSPF